MNKFRSILAVAIVATSITASVLPAQAFTLDELWGAVKKGLERAYQAPAEQPVGSNNESPQEATPANSSEQPSSSSNSSEPSQDDGDIDAIPVE